MAILRQLHLVLRCSSTKACPVAASFPAGVVTIRPRDGLTVKAFPGHGTGVRNTMTLWNAAYQRWLFWDGRADSLWSQAPHPIEDPLEMNGSRLQVAHHLQRCGRYEMRRATIESVDRNQG